MHRQLNLYKCGLLVQCHREDMLISMAPSLFMAGGPDCGLCIMNTLAFLLLYVANVRGDFCRTSKKLCFRL